MPGTATPPPGRRDLQSPKNRGCSRYPGLNHGDSPGDVEPSQDIFWDPTSPTPGLGHRSSRVVEISDIVNRIAPKDVKPKGTDFSLLQWIGDSSVPCTPEPRVRKRSSRQSSAEALLKLARQFDKNMQQDKESSEQLSTLISDLDECGDTNSKSHPTETPRRGEAKDLNCPSSASDQVEAELRALFDGPTQRVSHPLSQSSFASACSQEVQLDSVPWTSAKPRQSEQKSKPATQPAADKGPGGFCDDFDDDWENDDLLNDSAVLAMTQNPQQETDTQTNAAHLTSAGTAPQPSNATSQPGCSLLRELCPKPKTTNRSTFKLQSNPRFQPETKPQVCHQKSVPAKTQTAGSSQDTSDSLWEDGDDDDALLYQVCDIVERISNSQPQQVSPAVLQEKERDAATDGQRNTTAPVPIERAGPSDAGAARQSSCTFVRSNSLPGTSCKTANLQGWNVPSRGANNNNQSRMSQSLPGNRGSLGTFSQRRDSSGTFRVGNANVEVKPRTVTARAAQSAHHSAFKRNVSDSAAISNKVFVTSQMTGKCSAAEIERKKQEALSRRRLRMQNNPKP